MAKNTVEIRILGQRIPLKTSDTDPELIKEVVQLVTERIQEAEERARNASAPHQIALLALLDLAEEYIRAKRRTADFQKKVQDQSDHLLSLLDS